MVPPLGLSSLEVKLAGWLFCLSPLLGWEPPGEKPECPEGLGIE